MPFCKTHPYHLRVLLKKSLKLPCLYANHPENVRAQFHCSNYLNMASTAVSSCNINKLCVNYLIKLCRYILHSYGSSCIAKESVNGYIYVNGFAKRGLPHTSNSKHIT